MRIILIGFMATDKTTVGQLLGKQTQLPVFDLNQEIVNHAHMSIPAIFAHHGEQYFRHLEHQVLAEVINRHGILAAGGGTPMRPDNRQLLAASSAKIVFLQTSPQETLARLQKQAGPRPIADRLDATAIARLQGKRQPFYDECADETITTGHLTPAAIVQHILQTA